MATKMRSMFTSVSDKVFPGSGNLIDNSRESFIGGGNLLLSNLGLQMALYFNCHFSPIWFLICIIMLSLKYSQLGPYYKFVLIVVYVVMASLELIRLYLGYSGNLQEKVPELAGFWLVTFILQLPLTCFLLFNENALILPMERAVNIIMLLFMLFEVVQGYRAIKRMTDAQVEKFHLTHFNTNNIEMDDIGNIQTFETDNIKKYI
ncbi:transmembrane protein 17B-like isoform X2 [Hydractinia symbiolongicarpus]|uniref:transmembrane protein 17B-like isoform X2 n=1 Tax=Hydractinia symbiolongicarpus TaxID=13093 RepID=UPI0025500592|nr:transmembrane protein 17B-like isoform X2 [Hydractinia symbiolongicarpus]